VPKITPFLWYDGRAEEAAEFYTSIFDNSKIRKKAYYTEAGPGPQGSVCTVEFELDGQKFVALNGGPNFKFTEAISLMVECKDQKEIDYYWERLAEGGEHIECGWLKDKFGLAWQVTPRALNEMITDKDSARVNRVMVAMMAMKKLVLADLERAYEGR
jgi:predicted 3-demethylubiquinone-9 3-methyltransferase (glyoxalase superfamily)